jgi:hypothetical protein
MQEKSPIFPTVLDCQFTQGLQQLARLTPGSAIQGTEKGLQYGTAQEIIFSSFSFTKIF